MTLESWRYRDPMESAMRAEAQACKGCVHERKQVWFGREMMVCLREGKHGRKCKKYREAG